MLSIGFLMAFTLFLFYLPYSHSKMTFWTNTYPPFSDCSRYTAESNSSAIFGAEIEVIRSSLASLNWTEGLDYVFDCTSSDFATLINAINTKDDYQVGLIGGITMTSERAKQNYRFCQPTISFPVRLAYRQTTNGLFFSRGLDILAWIFLFLTLVIIGGLLYFLEDRRIAYINVLYNVLCQFFLFVDYPLSKVSSKFIYYLSTLLVLVTVITYTAASVNIFQIDHNLGNVISLDKMSTGQVVFANGVFYKYLEQFGLSPASADIYDPVDFINQIDKVGVNYLLVDGPYSDFVVRQHCELYTASKEIDLIHYGIMFHEKFPRDLQTLISVGISNAKRVRTFEAYMADYYNIRRDFYFCPEKVKYEEGTVALYEMRGLWYLLFCGIGIAALFVILDCLGLIVKKNLNIYDLKGVRARMDRKIQRRFSSIFAIHASISIQSIVFLKKLSQKVLENDLNTYKMTLPLSVLLYASLRVHMKFNKVSKQPDLSFKNSPLEWLKNLVSVKDKEKLAYNKSNALYGRRMVRSSVELGKINPSFKNPGNKEFILMGSQTNPGTPRIRPPLLRRRNGITDGEIKTRTKKGL